MKRTLWSCACGMLVGAMALPAYAQYGIFDSIADWEGRGDVKVEGNVEVTGEGVDAVYELWGNGDDIWENQDEGLFVYSELTGSWTLQGRVEWIDPGTHEWAKVGLMIREDAQDPESRHYWIELRGAGMGDRVDVQWRAETAGETVGSDEILFPEGDPLEGIQVDASLDGGLWFRVTRIAQSNTFISEFSEDGELWFVADTQTLVWDSDVAAFGLVITDHTDDDQLAHAQVTNVELTQRVFDIDSPIFDHHMDVYSTYDRLGADGGAEYDADNDTYTVWGSGWDIWDSDDAGHFLFTQVSGDFELIATGEFDVDRSDPPHDDWFKLMLWARQNLSAGSVNYGSRVRAGNVPTLDEGQFSYQLRLEQDGGSSSEGADRVMLGAELGLEEWTMRILREGDQFSLYYLEDFGPQAGEWVEVQANFRDTQVVPMEDPIFVGLGVTAHEAGAMVTGNFWNVELISEGPVSVSEWTLY